MTSHPDTEWTVLSPDISQAAIMNSPQAATETQTATEPQSTTDTPTFDSTQNTPCACNTAPQLTRRDSTDLVCDSHSPVRRRSYRVPPPRRYSPSPPPVPDHRRSSYSSLLLESSTQLLDKVGSYDGMMDMPHPARSSVYLTTYPFGTTDVRKWAWLLARGVEDVYMTEDTRSATYFAREVLGYRSREMSAQPPYWEVGGANSVTSVYLSRALDSSVVPEDAGRDVRFVVVTQNRHMPVGTKLQVTESRKAAAIVMYCELLKGDSVVFVGAMVHQCGEKMHPSVFRRVESLDEAIRLKEEGIVGVIC